MARFQRYSGGTARREFGETSDKTSRRGRRMAQSREFAIEPSSVHHVRPRWNSDLPFIGLTRSMIESGARLRRPRRVSPRLKSVGDNSTPTISCRLLRGFDQGQRCRLPKPCACRAPYCSSPIRPDVEELLAERKLGVSYESFREWSLKLGHVIAAVHNTFHNQRQLFNRPTFK